MFNSIDPTTFSNVLSSDDNNVQRALESIDQNSQAALGFTPRTALSAARTCYVRTDGSDSNDGSANDAAHAFLTIQKGLNVAFALDLNGYNVTISVADGTYTGAISITSPQVGAGQITLKGNTTTPANCVINNAGVNVSNGARLYLQGLKIISSSSCLNANTGSQIIVNGLLVFGAATAYHIFSQSNSIITLSANYTISGNAQVHIYAINGGIVTYSSGMTVTLTGTPAFSNAFVLTDILGVARAQNITYSGSATGKRYSATLNGVIQTYSGGNATYFPGSVAGTYATGGQYN